MMKKGFISALRRNKNMPTRPKEPALHLVIKIAHAFSIYIERNN